MTIRTKLRPIYHRTVPDKIRARASKIRHFHKKTAKKVLARPYFINLLKLKSPIYDSICGKDCFVLGSAPEPDLSLFDDEMALVTANGSAGNANALGLPSPTMTVIDFELLDENKLDENKTEKSQLIARNRKLLNGLNLGILIAAQSNNNQGGNPDILQAKYNHFVELIKLERKTIVHQVSGSKLLENNVHGLTSTGAFAIALCVYLGARSVTFAGFSLFRSKQSKVTPHFFNKLDVQTKVSTITDKNIEFDYDSRNHSLADSALISQLVLNGHCILNSHKDFLPLLQNWGSEPPSWAMRK